VRICFPASENRGLESPLAATFGGAPWLLIVDSESGDSEAIETAAGACRAEPVVIDLVVCRGMGRGLFERLTGQGIPVYGTRAMHVGAALADYRAGGAVRLGSGGCACSRAAGGCGAAAGGCAPGECDGQPGQSG